LAGHGALSFYFEFIVFVFIFFMKA